MGQEIIRIDLFGVNSYLGKEGDHFVLFDTGGHLFMDKEFDNRRKLLEEKLNQYGCSADNLKLIVLTHGDNDHAANAAYFKKKYNAKIAMHKGDLDLVKSPTPELIMAPKYKSPIFTMVAALIKDKIKKLCIKIIADYEPFQPDVFIEDGLTLSKFGFGATVVHLPGHTDGSVGILTKQGDLICGDILANTKKPDTAPNALNFKQLEQSVQKIKALKIKTIYPGHGDPFDASLIKKL